MLKLDKALISVVCLISGILAIVSVLWQCWLLNNGWLERPDASHFPVKWYWYHFILFCFIFSACWFDPFWVSKGVILDLLNVCLNVCNKINVNNGRFSIATLKPSYLLILEHRHQFLMHTKLYKNVTGIGFSHPFNVN